jgi:tetratricopeptide (TPR) repeat protein
LSIAECYGSGIDVEKAVAEYLKVIYLYPDQKAQVDQATFAAASMYEQQGKTTEAHNLYKKLVDTSANAELVEQAQQKLEELQ